VSRASATCEKYEAASGPSPIEHFELYIWLHGDELAFERGLAPRRGTILGKRCASYKGKGSHPDLLTHLHPLDFICLAILPHRVCWSLLSRRSKDEVWTVGDKS
jgi:hypothetical protein